jgi:DNA primase catalytic core
MKSERDLVVEELAIRADLAALAEELGMRVLARGSRQPKALCPFHEDRTPSLVFYPGGGSVRGQYHCFACGAHGDAYGLVMKLRNCDFRSALEWLSARLQIPLPQWDRRRTVEPREMGLQFAYEVFSNQSPSEQVRLKEFAAQRGYEVDQLKGMGVSAMEPPKLSSAAEGRGRETVESLLGAGLLRRMQLSPARGGVLPTELPPRDFFQQPRILFALREDHGRLVGFAGRALVPSDDPKYLYSPGFPRGETLYRLDHVRSAIRARSADRPRRVDVFAVEGLLDALRIESLGLNAVGIFGTQLTTPQAQLFAQLASDLDRDGCQLVVHLFLDADAPGRHALRMVVPRLLEAAASGNATGFLVDVVLPNLTETKGDPDQLLRACQSQGQVLSLVGGWTCSVVETLLADALPCAAADLNERCRDLPESYRARAYREIERHLKPEVWQRVIERMEPFARHLDSPQPALWPAARRELEAFLLSRPIPPTVLPPAIPFGPSRDELNQLQRAMQIALASGQRRELPVDEGSWERLDAAVEIAIPSLSDRLGAGRHNSEPLIATLVPKPPRDFRPKALACAETLTMQQYLLNELLREHPEAPGFSQAIPAIRYASGRNGGRPWMTGGSQENGPSETVSFAYQVDMDVLEGRVAPRREGMFRPYYRCWREFIHFIDRRAGASRVPLLHVARLDIRRFYDSIPRSVVIDALLPGLRDALSALADTAETRRSARACAPLFVPRVEPPAERAQRIVDWLCDESFNFPIEDPGTGEVERQRNGIPQGPDLSAYLANIVLFRLDSGLQKIVKDLDERAREERGDDTDRRAVRGGIYARYVDDIVLVARTPPDLGRMRSAVESQLTALGLTLSPKTEPLPPMDQPSFREWLTSERGVALGVSRIDEGPPSTDSLSVLDPLIDAGDVDRGDSLQILHSIKLENPTTSATEVANAVQTARLAHDLRHGDRVKAAQHIWRCVLRPAAGESPASPNEAASSFLKIWDETGGKLPRYPGRESEPRPTADLLAWLEGIDRLLGSRRDRDPSFSGDQHKEIHAMREALARLVHDGLCGAVVKLFRDADLARHNHMLQLRCMAILRAAILVVPDGGVPQWFIDEQASRPPRTAGQKRLVISIAQAGRNPALLDRAAQQDEGDDWLTLHEAAARLELGANRPPVDAVSLKENPHVQPLDPLAPLSQRLQPLRRFRELTASDDFFLQALGFLLPSFEGFNPARSENAQLAARAVARMLSAVSPQHLQQLLQQRPQLTNAILNGGNAHWQGKAIATPPGLRVPGLVGVEEVPNTREHQVVRVDFKAGEPVRFCPPDLPWTRCEGLVEGGLQPSKASLGPLQLLTPKAEGDPLPPAALAWLAEAFTALAGSTHHEPERFCVPTAVNLLGRNIGDAITQTVCHVLGYEVESSRLRGLAFIRRGHGLMLEPVADWQDHLWRAGTALADFLGRLDVSRSMPSLRLSAKANMASPESDWAVESMLRFSLTRLRGWGNRPSGPLPPSQPFPKSIARLLTRLRNFPAREDDDELSRNGRLAHLIATLTEGRALHLRGECDFDFSLPGGAAALLADVTRSLFRVDEELATRLPPAQALWPRWAPVRRPARAWFGLALRLDRLIKDDPQHDDPALRTVAAGTRLLSVQSQLRAQTLELWSLLDDADRERIRRDPTFEGEEPLDITALLHRNQETDPAYTGPWQNLRFLFDMLAEATAQNPGGRLTLLAGVTPLGWAIALARLVTEMMLKQPSAALYDVRGAVESATGGLMVSTDPDGEAPWDDLAPLAGELTEDGAKRVFAATAQLDKAMGFVVESRSSELFRLRSDPRTGLAKIDTDSGSYQFSSWRINYAGLPDERQGGVEQKLVGERYLLRWSQTSVSDRLVAIGVVQPHLASLSAMESSDSEHPEPTTQLEGELPFARKLQPVAPDSRSEAPSPPSPAVGTAPAERPAPLPPRPEPAATAGATSLLTIKDPLDQLRRIQEKSWASRPPKAARHARVALFQWDLDETYRHPIFDACLRGFGNRPCLNSEGDKIIHPERWIEPGELPSCAEHRRRALLSAALCACRAFKVDILLLPEYSIRPDTAAWLTTRIRESAPTTSVWAGTYRQPPEMSLRVSSDEGQPPPWSAVMPIVLAPEPGGQEWRIRLRRKKYPAVSASEVFWPTTASLEPTFKATSATFDPRAFTNELICSEAFLVTSPANFLGMVDAFQRLLVNFGEHPQRSFEELLQQLEHDVTTFARYTSLSYAQDQPRLLLLVPAMTTRSVDYSILGQAGFLASAITTVFCNAVAGRFGCGESCIVGYDSWGKEGEEPTGMPGLGPYHGVLPGIYHPKRHNSGRLGKADQALVIADVDPVYSPEGKPRPQMLPPPLSLVAHLPVIESSNQIASRTSCQCQRWQREDRMQKVRGFAGRLLQRFSEVRGNTGDDRSPEKLAGILEDLEKLVLTRSQQDQGQGDWLRERREAYLREHAACPRQWPPPVALDWLFADLVGDYPNFPKLEVPAYSLAAGETRLPDP